MVTYLISIDAAMGVVTLIHQEEDQPAVDLGAALLRHG